MMKKIVTDKAPAAIGPYSQGIVVDENVITAKGPGLSSDFAFCLIEKLVGGEIADQVYDAAQY